MEYGLLLAFQGFRGWAWATDAPNAHEWSLSREEQEGKVELNKRYAPHSTAWGEISMGGKKGEQLFLLHAQKHAPRSHTPQKKECGQQLVPG